LTQFKDTADWDCFFGLIHCSTSVFIRDEECSPSEDVGGVGAGSAGVQCD